MKSRLVAKPFGFVLVVSLMAASLLLAACGSAASVPVAQTAPEESSTPDADSHDADHATPLSAVALAPGEKLRVVATTNIVADVVRQVGGDKIELVALLAPGTDPHSYQPTPDDLRQLNDAHVIFINGFHLEEAMAPVLENLDTPTPIISVNDGVATRVFSGEAHGEEGEEGEAADHAHEHEGADPHTWMNVANMLIWSENVEHALSALDPAHSADYMAAAERYGAALQQLDDEIRTQLAEIPAEQRKLVTDHDNLGYLADAYGFTVLGAVIPSLSTMAAPSAQQMAALQDQIRTEGVKVILVGNTVNPAAAQQLAQDSGAKVVPIFTDSLSGSDGPAATYVAMMRHNIGQIVAAFNE